MASHRRRFKVKVTYRKMNEEPVVKRGVLMISENHEKLNFFVGNYRIVVPYCVLSKVPRLPPPGTTLAFHVASTVEKDFSVMFETRADLITAHEMIYVCLEEKQFLPEEVPQYDQDFLDPNIRVRMVRMPVKSGDGGGLFLEPTAKRPRTLPTESTSQMPPQTSYRAEGFASLSEDTCRPRLISQGVAGKSKEIMLLACVKTETCGFFNIGNSCFMNAMLQGLLANIFFTKDLFLFCKKIQELGLDLDTEMPMSSAIACLASRRRRASNKMRAKLLRIIKVAANFKDFAQHDAHEFLVNVLDQVKEECDKMLRVQYAIEDEEERDRQNPVTVNFGFVVEFVTTCDGCHCTVKNEEKSVILPVSIDALKQTGFRSTAAFQPLSAQTLLNEHLRVEKIERKCEYCNSLSAQRSQKFTRVPRCLIIFIKRYVYISSVAVKRDDNVEIPIYLTLNKHCVEGVASPPDVSPAAMELDFNSAAPLFKRCIATLLFESLLASPCKAPESIETSHPQATSSKPSNPVTLDLPDVVEEGENRYQGVGAEVEVATDEYTATEAQTSGTEMATKPFGDSGGKRDEFQTPLKPPHPEVPVKLSELEKTCTGSTLRVRTLQSDEKLPSRSPSPPTPCSRTRSYMIHDMRRSPRASPLPPLVTTEDLTLEQLSRMTEEEQLMVAYQRSLLDMSKKQTSHNISPVETKEEREDEEKSVVMETSEEESVEMVSELGSKQDTEGSLRQTTECKQKDETESKSEEHSHSNDNDDTAEEIDVVGARSPMRPEPITEEEMKRITEVKTDTGGKDSLPETDESPRHEMPIQPSENVHIRSMEDTNSDDGDECMELGDASLPSFIGDNPLIAGGDEVFNAFGYQAVVYKPLSEEKRNEICLEIGVNPGVKWMAESSIQRMSMNDRPVQVVVIEGTNNNLFQALAYYLTGNEKNHWLVRKSIVQFEVEHKEEFMAMRDCEAEEWNEHMNGLLFDIESGCFVELFAFASMFDVDIWVFYNKRWFCYRPKLSMFSGQWEAVSIDDYDMCEKEAIYLAYENELFYPVYTPSDKKLQHDEHMHRIFNILRGTHESTLHPSYRLMSVVSHLGEASNSGHYICDIWCCKSKFWFFCDDTLIAPVDEASVQSRSTTGYIYLYLNKELFDSF